MEEYPKNSLLGQLEEKGIFNKSDKQSEPLPFGLLTGNFDMSPFAEQNQEEEKNTQNQKIIKKRLNDLDGNIFQEPNFLNIADDELTDEEKIQKIKKMIKKIDEKIFMLEDSDDYILIKKLKDEKETLVETIKLLGANEASEAGFVVQNEKVREFANKMHIKDKLREMEKILFKFCPILHKIFLVRHALNKLVMLNESAKELMLKKIPYGESEGRYNDFIAYLSCANVIHAKLTKKI